MITDEMVSAARQKWLELASDYTRLDECLRGALEAAMNVTNDNAQNNDIVSDLRSIAGQMEKRGLETTADDIRESAACIEELAKALRASVNASESVLSCEDGSETGYLRDEIHNAKITLARWGLEK